MKRYITLTFICRINAFKGNNGITFKGNNESYVQKLTVAARNQDMH